MIGSQQQSDAPLAEAQQMAAPAESAGALVGIIAQLPFSCYYHDMPLQWCGLQLSSVVILVFLQKPPTPPVAMASVSGGAR